MKTENNIGDAAATVGAGTGATQEICKSLNNNIVFLIFCIFIIIIIISMYILALNIISYILFTIYCINDNITDYTTEDPATIILGNKYKFRLLNYISNLNNNANKIYILNNSYDNLSSDLYIHNTIIYYNYIVKLLLIIIVVILIAVAYNMFNIIFARINKCEDPTINCAFNEVYNNNMHIYYIIIIIFIYICAHSYIYTYGFNKNIYKDIFDLYSGGSNYKSSDIIVSNNINFLNTEKDASKPLSQYLEDLKNMSYNSLQFKVFLDEKNVLKTDADIVFQEIINNGIIENNKFVIPTELENEDNTNILFKTIYNYNINDPVLNEELLASKIYIYLIYHYVISHNREDPIIIHKLNNIYLRLFENIYKNFDNEAKARFEKGIDDQYAGISANILSSLTNSLQITSLFNKDEAKDKEAKDKEAKDKEAKDKDIKDAIKTASDNKKKEYKSIDRNVLLSKFNIGIRNMYNDIKVSYTIKLLLPAVTKKEDILMRLHHNADLILKYIYKYKDNEDKKKSITQTDTDANYSNLKTYKQKPAPVTPAAPGAPGAAGVTGAGFSVLKDRLKEKIDDFAETFFNFRQENKTLEDINRIVYKVNFYLAIEMLVTIIFILIVLLLLYKSNKYPFLEKYINIAITYAILIINEVISAILGIV